MPALPAVGLEAVEFCCGHFLHLFDKFLLLRHDLFGFLQLQFTLNQGGLNIGRRLPCCSVSFR
ncbi:MAG: hypothetical protein M5U34_34885 [Chloroflexi bacterium]|nr:hypothetical protein [Chloroflexota bacterium]